MPYVKLELYFCLVYGTLPKKEIKHCYMLGYFILPLIHTGYNSGRHICLAKKIGDGCVTKSM